MTFIKNLDSFIERTSSLLAARPDSTKISTTYSHKKAKSGDVANSSSKPALAIIKAYDPVSGACFKAKIVRSNELSRIMSALGPRGVSITKQNRKEDGQVETSIKQQKGISSLMSDKEFASPVEAVEGGANSATTPTTSGSNLSQAGGSKKKKGKRK